MRPFTFTSFQDRRITVNPGSVLQVETAFLPADKRYAVTLMLSGQPAAEGTREGTRMMRVAEFEDRDAAERIGERIGEHLWSDEAPALNEDEQRLVADNPATQDADAFAGHRHSTPSTESMHPALVAERENAKATDRRNRKLTSIKRTAG